MVQATTATAPATTPALTDLERALIKLGYEQGTPDHVSAAADAKLYRYYPCTCCGRRATAFKPYHRGQRHYRAVLVCRACGHTEEV